MHSDAQIFADWLSGKATVNGITFPKATVKRERKQPVTLNAELAKPMGIVGGLTAGGKGNSNRTGYVGQRTSAPELTSDCIVTRPNGDRFVLKTTRKRSTGKRTVVTVKNDNAAQYARMLRLGVNNVD